ncbi:MAG: NAD-binding protein [Anaerolineae bacterium]|nr:NAD-binding protein [Anaerolineae bacterium]
MRKASFTDKLRYQFDNTMSAGPIALIGWLSLLTLTLVVAVALVVVATGVGPQAEDGSRLPFGQMVWFSLMHAVDAGALGADGGNPWFLGAMTVATLGGIFIFSTLIGILTSGIESKLDELRKGRSFVVESNHTIILGWSTQVFPIISELVIANQNRPRACIVVMAEVDKVMMEDEIRARIPDTGKTRIVCRTGSPIDLNDLEMVNPGAARSIIILSNELGDPDSQVIKTILALTNSPDRRPEPYHIVAEIRDWANLEVAKMVAGDEAQLVLVEDLISRIAVQTCRQSGLSIVYNELLDFGGDEIYFKHEPELVGKSVGDALLAYEDSTVIGLQHRNGMVTLLPPLDSRIESGDTIIAISEDDDTIRLSGSTPLIDADAIQQLSAAPARPERTLILGWNRRATTIINELDNYVAPGSEVLVVTDAVLVESAITEHCPDLANLNVSVQDSRTTDRRVLDALDVTSYDHVITLSSSDVMTPQEADALTLITLLHLRDIGDKTGRDLSIVSEMLDLRNRELAEVTRADDFIVSDRLISLLLSQVSENRSLMAVFDDLFDPEGAEIYLKPATDYVRPGQPVSFYTLVEAARRRGEIAIGYRQAATSTDASRSYGVVVNPEKSARVSFTAEDRIIVLAEA